MPQGLLRILFEASAADTGKLTLRQAGGSFSRSIPLAAEQKSEIYLNVPPGRYDLTVDPDCVCSQRLPRLGADHAPLRLRPCSRESMSPLPASHKHA
ncbi:hypothetical protein ACFL59_03110 [Planctomycetota bacterium]